MTDSGEHVIDVVFLCTIEAGEPYGKSKTEVAEFIWMTTTEIVEDDAIPVYLKENIKQAAFIIGEQ
ncbi:hypothetical protein AB990_03440 [Alkalihalobacillus pseudalcaliphilus]|nr:hypothetical protein AB990_03440 [Alkalihalobacillus pseudalcaliphilus]